jgi:mevalonate kinase
VLKSKQAIRNEIYQKSAKIVDDYIGENGSASQALKEAYNADDNTEQVKELIESMHKKIDELYFEYEPYLQKDQLLAILNECKSGV